MAFHMSIESDIKKATRGLTKIQKKQVPFATARALTWTVQDAQKEIIESIPSNFNVTKKWWLKQQPTGIKIRPAKKNRLVASVYTQAFFADLQERGGTKHPYKSRNLLVPTGKVPKSRRKAGGAAVMLRGKKVFQTSKGIYRRKGSKKSPIVELLFTRAPSAKIRPRFEFRRTAQKAARKNFRRNMRRSLDKALATAR